ncbi:MAG: S8 family serine peptidase [Candidatus Cryptobacteroides sp.]
MNRIFNKIIFAAAIACLTISCNVAAPEAGTNQPSPEMTDDVLSGQLLIRFDASVADLLSEAGLTKAASTKSGVTSVDEVLSILEGCTLERVFPVDSRTEDKAVQTGLNLWYVVRFPEDVSVEELAMRLSALGEVSRVEYNRAVRKAYSKPAIPLTTEDVAAVTKAGSDAVWNDPELPYQWHLVNDGNLKPEKFIAGCDVNVRGAWKKCAGDPSIIVAVVDEGVDCFHEDLQASMWVNEGEIWRSKDDNDGNGYAGDVHGYNFARNSGVIATDSKYDTGHGTHVAGVIAAMNNNGKGISSIAGGDGVNPGVRIMSCQIFSGQYTASVLDEVRAIKYAADNGAVILQCSWGYTSGSSNPYEWTPQYSTDEEWKYDCPLEVAALDYFIHYAGSPDGVIEGGIAIFAGGNEDAPAAGYPGAYKDFVSVAATAGDFTPAIYSNYGTGIKISAPGGDQDYYWNYDERGDLGAIGCVLSTLPTTISEVGYGYMEGTSMACPHVSGVVALGLSYAAKLRKHFTAEEFIDMLYESASLRPLETAWDLDSPKVYYKYVADLGLAHKSSIDLNEYRGQMGAGMVNAEGLLQLVEDDANGGSMSFPNVTVAVGSKASYCPTIYIDGNNFSVTVSDGDIAGCTQEGKTVVFTGKKPGQTGAEIRWDGGSQKFVITVKTSSSSNGWL